MWKWNNNSWQRMSIAYIVTYLFWICRRVLATIFLAHSWRYLFHSPFLEKGYSKTKSLSSIIMAHRSMSMYNRTPTLKEGTPKLREEFLRELLDLVHERYSVTPSGKQSTLSVNKNIIRQASLITIRTSYTKKSICSHF